LVFVPPDAAWYIYTLNEDGSMGRLLAPEGRDIVPGGKYINLSAVNALRWLGAHLVLTDKVFQRRYLSGDL
jgi:hypothetical protein